MEDITKEGIEGLEGLKGLNRNQGIKSLDLDSIDVSNLTEEELNNLDNSFVSLDAIKEGLRTAPTLTEFSSGHNIGTSMFDNHFLSNDDIENPNNMRAENQPWYAQLAAGIAKGGVIAGTTWLDSIIGFATGLLNGIASVTSEDIDKGFFEGFIDNPFSRAMMDVNNYAEELMPNYYSENELNQPWYKNIFTANFLGDKLLKNVGFTVGAMYSGGIYAKGLGTLVKSIQSISKAAPAVATVTGTVLSSVNEARNQALSNKDDGISMETQKIDMRVSEELNALEKEYQIRNSPASLELGQLKLAMSEEEYNDRYNEIIRAKELALAKLEESAVNRANVEFGINTAVLMIPNFLQFGKWMGRGMKTQKQMANNIRRVSTSLSEGVESTLKKPSVLYKMGENFVSEGIGDEGSQYMVQKSLEDYQSTEMENYWKKQLDPDAKQETLSYIESFAKGIGSSLTDGGYYETVFLGGLSGGLMSFGLRSPKNKKGEYQSPIYLRDNVEYEEEKQATDKLVTDINARLAKDSKLTSFYQGLIAHYSYQKDMDNAVLRDNELDYKNAEFGQAVSDIIMFDKAGMLSDLQDLYNANHNTSPENLAFIVKSTTKKDDNGKLIGPYAKYAIVDKSTGKIEANLNEKNQTEVAEIVDRNFKELKKNIENYVKTKEDLDYNYGSVLSEEQIQELTFLSLQSGNFLDRSKKLINEVKPILNTAITDATKENSNKLNESDKLKERIVVKRKSINNKLKYLTNKSKRRNLKVEKRKNLEEQIAISQKALKELDSIEKGDGIDSIIERFKKVFIKNLEKENIGIQNLSDLELLRYLTSNENSNINSLLSILLDVSGENIKENFQKKFDDSVDLFNAYTEFSRKLEEYVKNPNQLNEDKAIVAEEAEKENKEKADKQTRDEINNSSSREEVDQVVNNSENPNAETIAEEEAINGNVNAQNNIKAKSVEKIINEELDKLSPILKATVESKLKALFRKHQDISDIAAIRSDAEADNSVSNNVKEEVLKILDVLQGNKQELETVSTPVKPKVNNTNNNTSSTENNSNNTIQKTEEELADETLVKEYDEVIEEPTEEEINTLNGIEDMLLDSTKDFQRPVIPKFHIEARKQKHENIDFVEITKNATLNQVYTLLYRLREWEYRNKELVEKGNSPLKAISKKYPNGISQNTITLEALKKILEEEGYLKLPSIENIVRFAESKTSEDYSVLYQELSDRGAFDYVDQGKLQEGEIIYYSIEPALNKKVGDSIGDPATKVILLKTKDGQVVGSLDSLAHSGGFTGLTRLINDIHNEYLNWQINNNGKEAVFTSKKTTSVLTLSYNSLYNKEYQPLGNILEKDEIPYFAIVKNGSLTTNDSQVDSTIYYGNTSLQEGNVLIINRQGRPQHIRINNFHTVNSTVFSNSEFYKEFEAILSKLGNLKSNDKSVILDLKTQLSKYLQVKDLSFFYNKDNSITLKTVSRDSKGKLIKDADGKVKVKNEVKVNLNDKSSEAINLELYSFFIDSGFKFQIDLHQINDSEYRKKVIDAGILSTNLASLDNNGSYFLLNYYDENGEFQEIETLDFAQQKKEKEQSKTTSSDSSINNTTPNNSTNSSDILKQKIEQQKKEYEIIKKANEEAAKILGTPKRTKKLPKSVAKIFRAIDTFNNSNKTEKDIQAFFKEVAFMKNNIYKGGIYTDESINAVDEILESLKKEGYEFVDIIGKPAVKGSHIVKEVEYNKTLPPGSAIITTVRAPQINKDGVVIQRATVIITIGPEIEDSNTTNNNINTNVNNKSNPTPSVKPNITKEEDAEIHSLIENLKDYAKRPEGERGNLYAKLKKQYDELSSKGLATPELQEAIREVHDRMNQGNISNTQNTNVNTSSNNTEANNTNDNTTTETVQEDLREKIIKRIREQQKFIEKTDKVYLVKEEDGKTYEYKRVTSIVSPVDLSELRKTLQDIASNKEATDKFLKTLEQKHGFTLSEDIKDLTKVENRKKIIELVKENPVYSEATQSSFVRGTTVDTIVRDFFNNNLLNEYKGISKQAFDNLINHLKELKSHADENDVTFYTDNIALFHKYKDGTRIAGEVDILAIDKNGEVYIYDVKTTKNSFKSSNGVNLFDWTINGQQKNREEIQSKVNTFKKPFDIGVKSTKAKYTDQLSAYKNLFESQYGIKVQSLEIIGFVNVPGLNNNEIAGITNVEYIPIEYNESVVVPRETYTEPTLSNEAIVETIIEAVNENPLNTEDTNTVEEVTPKETKPIEETVNYDFSEYLNNSDIVDEADGSEIVYSQVVSQEGTTIDIEKELKWLDKVLPQYSKEQRVKIIEDYIKIGNSGKLAEGSHADSIITLSKLATKGTTYHEAFHGVFRDLLSNEERTEILEEAKTIYGNKSKLLLEEDLAEAFRNYVLTKQKEGLGTKILNFFKRLFNLTSTHKEMSPYLNSLFYKINQGKYAKRALNSSKGTALSKENYTLEQQSIKDRAIKNGTFMKAPNGNNTNLTERQWIHVRTKEFKDWFGDWENDPENASKVLDENGEPLVVYHGTIQKPFTIFNIDKRRYKLSSKLGNHIYFTDNKRLGKYFSLDSIRFQDFISTELENTPGMEEMGYENNDVQRQQYFNEVFEYILRKTDLPLTIQEAQDIYFGKSTIKERDYLYEVFLNIKEGIILDAEGEYINNLSSNFYTQIKNSDSVIIKNVIEEIDYIPSTDYLITNPNQIKSATDNIGTYSSENNDIRYSEVKTFKEEVSFDKYFTELQNQVQKLNVKTYNSEQSALNAFNESGIPKEFFYRIKNLNPRSKSGRFKIQLITNEMFDIQRQELLQSENVISDMQYKENNRDFDTYSNDKQATALSKGWTKESFNSHSQEFKDSVMECY